MKSNTALYIGADPLTFNDQDLIKKCINAFGFIYIILDRKNRDAEFDRYYLSYADRADIIKHDMAQYKDFFQILPADLTIQKVISDNNITNLVLNLDYQKETGFKMQSAMRNVINGINIFCLEGKNFLGNHFIHTISTSDSSMQLHKTVCSDYAYAKFKVKTTKKIGITGNMGCKMENVLSVFKDHDYNVIDLDEYTFKLYEDQSFIGSLEQKYIEIGMTGLDEFIHKRNGKRWIDKCDILRYNLKHLDAQDVFEKFLYAHIRKQIMNNIVTNYSDVIVIKFVLIYEYAMEQMFDKIIVASCDKKCQYQNLTDAGYDVEQIQSLFELQQDVSEKTEYADYVINTNKSDDDVKNSTIVLMNSKLKKLLEH